MKRCKKEECRPVCRPKCKRRCVGVVTNTYKIYENCCYSVVKVCPCCGGEIDYHRHNACPHCGMMMDDPPRHGGFGGRRIGRIGHFGGFGHFGHFGHHGLFDGGFFPFGFGFFPEFEEEEEEEEY